MKVVREKYIHLFTHPSQGGHERWFGEGGGGASAAECLGFGSLRGFCHLCDQPHDDDAPPLDSRFRCEVRVILVRSCDFPNRDAEYVAQGLRSGHLRIDRRQRWPRPTDADCAAT